MHSHQTSDVRIRVEERSPAIRALRLVDSPDRLTPPAAASLIERDRERAVIEQAVRHLSDGRGEVVVLESAPGLGKTTLLDHAAELAANAACLIRRAAPGPHEHDFPYGVVRSLLETPLRDAAEHERRRLFRGPAGAAGGWLLGGRPASTGESVAAVAHGVLWLCSALAAERPLALIVDDAQWADPVSLEVLLYVARRIEGLPLLLMLAARPFDPRAARGLISLTGGVPSATVLRPAPLSSAGATRLIRRYAPQAAPAQCLECHAAVGGIPWLLRELAEPDLRTSTAGREVVRRRLAELTPPGRSVATAMAVIGAGAPPHAVAAVAGIGLEGLGGALDVVAAGGLLTPDGERFAHEVIPGTILEDLPAAVLERLHHESARALIALGGPADAVAEHLLACRPRADAEISELLGRAAREATHRGTPADAARYLERALAERSPHDDRAGLLADLARASFDAGRPRSREPLLEALRQTDAQPARLDLLTQLAGRAAAEGDADDVLQLLEDEHTPETADGVALEAAALDALVAMPDRQLERARRIEAIELTKSSDPVLRRVVLAHRAWLAIELGAADASACAAMALDALTHDLLLREAGRRAAYDLCVRVLVLTDQIADARRAIGALRDEAERRGSVPLHAAAELHAADLALRAGDVRQAERHARAALELAGEAAVLAARAAEILAEALVRLGRRAEAVAMAEAELAAAERFGAPVRLARALIARAVAERDDAVRVALCERGLAMLAGGTGKLESVRLRLELGSALVRMGRRVEARQALRPALADADALGAAELSTRVRRELVATGLRPRRAALAGAPALTPRERQICELAATGKANRAIAQQLFLSVKTVETHLAAGFRKLGVRARGELRAALSA